GRARRRALLGPWGHRIRPARDHGAGAHERGVFVRLARLVQRRAVPIVLVVGAGLAVLRVALLPAPHQAPHARSLPTSSESRRIAALVDTRFAAGARTGPVVVLAEVDGSSPALADYVGRL